MNNQAIMTWMLAGALGLSLAVISHAQAQSTLGGAKNPQNKIGGAAKPAPVLGGTTLRAPSPPAPTKPAPAMTTTKPGSGAVGTTTSLTTHAAGDVRPNPPPVTPPNKGAAAANLKCAAGACTTRGGKP